MTTYQINFKLSVRMSLQSVPYYFLSGPITERTTKKPTTC